MIWTALILGFAGSFHCFGMCSPLAMAVTNLSPMWILNRIIYNSGRLITYGIMGGIVAFVGLAVSLVKYQNVISILLGLALLIIGVTGLSIRIPFLTKALGQFNVFVKTMFASILKAKNHSSIFFLGALNGLLPCGLSFLALTYCLTLAGPTEGVVFMMLFGAGTLPVMLGFTSIFHWAINRFHLSGKRLTTGMFIISGGLLIARVFFVHLPQAASIQEGVVDIVLCR